MKRLITSLAAVAIAWGSTASAEILAMMNYQSKAPDQVKALKLTGVAERREGIAIVDVDPGSETFGKLLIDIPLDPSGVAHHLFYDRTMSKVYVTALGQPPLRVIDMAHFPYRVRTVDIPNCTFGEDIIFDEANEFWYLTCMTSANVWQGRVATDEITGEIKLPDTYPHGLGVNSQIDRILVTSTVAGDLSDPREVVSVVKASTLHALDQIKVTNKESPSGVAPVEILPVPGAERPTFYVTNMFGLTLWALVWDEQAQNFEASEVYDFTPLSVGVLLEMYFNDAGDRMYVTTASPGHLHIFDMSRGPMSPKLVKSLPTGEGAHHVGITRDERYAFVQNSLLNLPGMSDGSITVIDLEKGEVVASVDTLKNMGLNPNSIVLLPEWNHLAGH